MADVQIRTGIEAVTTPSTVVVFSSPMPSADFVLTWVCLDASDPETTIGCAVNPALFTVNGFTVAPVAAGSFRYIAAEDLGEIVAPTERLSHDWTCLEIWNEAVHDLRLDVKALPFAYYNLLNRVISHVVGEFYGLLHTAYRTTVNVTGTGDTVGIESARIMLAMSEPKLVLESTGTTAIGPVSEEELRIFRTAAPQNKNRIVWNVSGDYIYMAKGSGLSTYGTLTLRYSRIPTVCDSDDDMIDVPDGPLTEMIILRMKYLLSQRYGDQSMPAPSGEMERLVRSLYAQMGVTASLEEMKEKVKRIL